MSTTILRGTLAHFAAMPADEARRASALLRDEIYVLLESMYTAPDGMVAGYPAWAEVPGWSGVSVRVGSGTQDMLTVLQLVEDICAVLEDSGEKKLAEVLDERRYDYTARPRPLSRLLDLWESPDLRE